MKRNPCKDCIHAYRDERTKRFFPSFLSPYCERCEDSKKHKEYLESKRKFYPGEQIYSVDELLKEEWVMWNGYTKHIEVIKSMTLRTVETFIKHGAFQKAIRKEN